MSQSHETTRKFGFWSAHFVVVASMIGAGILTTSGFTLRETGNPPALLGLWLIGGCMALAGAVTVAELATMMPRAGGDYLYVREGYGPAAGFVCGWSTFILGFAAPTAVVALTASNYLLAFLSEETLSQ
ncbi:MAG TPA: amino acid permease, partial [Gemmatales bacterium]|nr:amino acid permease [Gemmatales bacterium]